VDRGLRERFSLEFFTAGVRALNVIVSGDVLDINRVTL